MTTQLQQISEIAWIVYKDNQQAGILNKDVQDHYTYINGTQSIKLDDDEKVGEHFGNANIFEEQITDDPVKNRQFYLKGHLVTCEDPHPIEPGHPDYNPDIPLYRKTANSDVLYAAGWYCVNFEKCWKHGRGTKYATLQKYGFEGPYKTYEQVKSRLKVLNQDK